MFKSTDLLKKKKKGVGGRIEEGKKNGGRKKEGNGVKDIMSAMARKQGRTGCEGT